MSDFWLIPRGDAGGMRLKLEPPGPVTIGRAPGLTVTLPDRGVSRNHAVLQWSYPSGDQPGHWRLTDLGSQGGTFVNGVRLRGERSLRVESGDVIEIPPYSFELIDRSERPRSDATFALPEQIDSTNSVLAVEPEGASGLAQDQLLAILSTSNTLHQAADERSVYEILVDGVVSLTGFPNAALVRLENEGESAELLAARGQVVDRFGRPSISRSIVRRASSGPIVIRDAGFEEGPQNGTINTLHISRAICLPVEHGAVRFGFLYLDDRDSADTTRDIAAVANAAHVLVRLAALSLANLARLRMEQRLQEEQRLMFGGTMHALISAIDAKDRYTRGHSDRVSAFAALLAEQANLGTEMIERARLCGLVHDIGKIGVPESILSKPGRLTDEEFAAIAAHPQIGFDILRDIPQMREVLCGVLEHHERWDGTGYPQGKKGEEISLLGRIICLADCFDAMTSARTYRPARTIDEVLEEIRRCLGTHFDPKLGEAFLSIPIERLRPHVAPPPAPVDEVPSGETRAVPMPSPSASRSAAA
ncbi:MAG: HD domain-containing protein [Phycisphaeraceae bacterium]|nr:HD domain-containing protein [Phycisphaeraceae bacterium]